MGDRHPRLTSDITSQGVTSAPAWARGYPLDELRDSTSVFTNAHRPHVYGAFGLVKERDVASARAEGNFHLINCGSARAAAIGHLLHHGSSHTDFSGSPIRIPASTYFVKSFAADKLDVANDLLSKLVERYTQVVIEIFEEDRVARAAVESRHMHYLGSKVTAAGEVKGLYTTVAGSYSGTPRIQQISLARLRTEFVDPKIIRLIRKELNAYDKYEQHYSSYNKRRSWSAFALRGFRPDDPGFIIKPAEMARSWKDAHPGSESWTCDNTTIADKFPATWKLVKKIPCAGLERVRFMRLAENNGELSRHADITDRAAGPGIGHVARLHVPIHTNPGVQFLSWDARGRRKQCHLEEGSLWYLDTRKPHAVINTGSGARVHLVIDVVCNKHTQDLLTDMTGVDP